MGSITCWWNWTAISASEGTAEARRRTDVASEGKADWRIPVRSQQRQKTRTFGSQGTAAQDLDDHGTDSENQLSSKNR